MRHDIADYLNIAKTGTTEEYVLMGTGFKTLDESPGASVEKEAFISDRSKTASVDGYEPSFAFDSYLLKDEKAIMDLYGVGRNQLTGIDAERDIVRADIYDPVVAGTPNVVKARKIRVSVEISDCSGEGAKAVSVKGNLNQVGDIIQGKFDTTTRAFTADTNVTTPPIK